MDRLRRGTRVRPRGRRESRECTRVSGKDGRDGRGRGEYILNGESVERMDDGWMVGD